MANKENKTVIKRAGDNSKIFCQEDYAQELYDRMFGTEVVQKDFKNGDVTRVTDFRIVSKENKEIEAICENYTSLFFNLSREKKYFSEILGMDEDNFFNWVESNSQKTYLKEHKIYATVENHLTGKGSIYGAHLQTITAEFKEQIGKPTNAYLAKVINKNQGGFIVEVQGVKAFLPGSLAAANKITNFENFIGKEIHVMIEDFLKSSGIFVVSYKKYLDHILPSKLADLERNQLMTGIVTGSSKFGVFAEFEGMFSGLLHMAEMTGDTLEKFNDRGFKPGDEIEAWLKDIRDNKLILTEMDPAIKQLEMESYREKIENSIREAVIVSIKPHGALMEIEKGILGLLPVKEMKKSGKRLNVGESIEVFIKKVDTSTGKIYLTMHDERITAEA
jgi:predicted RNA-binding protein with RPS1 domain